MQGKREQKPREEPGLHWEGGAGSLTVLAGEQEGDLHYAAVLGPLVVGRREQPERALRREGGSGTPVSQASRPQECHTSSPKDVSRRPPWVHEHSWSLEMG